MRRSFSDARNSGLTDASAFLALTALNLTICWRLFKVEYVDHFASVEGFFIAMARYMSRHWGDFSWWPLWHCGMPFQDTYVPLLHMVVAATASLAHLSAARAYHGVVGFTYALGPATLYLMAVRLRAGRGAALLSALFYSLFSPSVLLMPEVARQMGAWWYPRRLEVLTSWGEGPHITAMTLIPMAILALEGALTRKTGRALAWAAISVSLVFLTNVPGTMALGMIVFCWICAQPGGRRLAAWIVAASASALAYGLACFGVPPSSLLTVAGNVGPMHPGFLKSFHYGPILLALLLGAVMLAGHLLARTRLPLVVRFAVLFFGTMAVLALTDRNQAFELLPQAKRLHLEMEMGACLLLGCLGWAAYGRIPRRSRPLAWVAAAVLFTVQLHNFRAGAHAEIPRSDLEGRSEYTTARWLDANMNGGRVYVAGSTRFWLNAFTDTPQLTGCCDQSMSMPAVNEAFYKINLGQSREDTEAAENWLKAFGIQALVVNGPSSTDEYKDIQAPERFEGHFPVLHRENGDTIYAVLPKGTSLAHVFRPGEQVAAHPSRQVEYADILQYVRVAGDASHPAASFTWLRGSVARIRANLRRDDLVSVQVAWFPGWKAYVGGQSRPVSADGLGFLLLRPECQGNCEITLAWTGRPDLPFAGAVTAAAVALTAWMFYTGRPRVKTFLNC